MDERKTRETRHRGPATAGDASRTTRPADSSRNERWVPDPADIHRHARMFRERRRVGPLGKLVRYAVVVAMVAAAVAAYWNLDTLRGISVDFPQLTALLHGRSDGRGAAPAGGEPETAVVESAGVAGVEAPTSLSGSPPAREAAAPEQRGTPAPAAAPPTPEPAPSPVHEPPEPAAAPAPAAPAAAPAPPEPERFSFGGVARIEVNEADASAAVLVLRSGDMRRPSSVRWWTTDGTAKAGQDYVDLGRVVLKFAAQEQNRAIRVPIIGDKTAEGPESFYVNLAWGENEGPAERIEVVIIDDD